jgi:hypothetical protein
MARDRKLSSDFWTWEAIIDCAPMIRLLFLGLQNFADDFGVQPLRPRTIRMQVLPGDAIDNDQVRAMIEELVARGLVRVYSVEGQEYLAIVDWERLHRIGKRARRRYPAAPDAAPVVGAMEEGRPVPTSTTGTDDAARSPPGLAATPGGPGKAAARQREAWPNGPPDGGGANPAERLAVPASA